ncbi:hypothetical protein J6U76_00135 [bacterium]|nr:hypothetical protein [bacterium]MBP1589650.1 hypothetical protein [Kiritimatiellia bacterium]
MAPDNFALGGNAEYENAKQTLKTVRQRWLAAMEELADLKGPAKRFLEADYMLKLGGKEMALYEAKIAVQRLRRAISLHQAAANRGTTLTKAEVEAQLDAEFAEFARILAEMQQAHEQAERQLAAPLLSAAEMVELKKLYRSLARRLHPDVNSSLPPKAAPLWNQAVEAYQDRDLPRLRLVADLAQELFGDHPLHDLPADENPLDTLRSQIALLEQRLVALGDERSRLLASPPFTFKALLDDATALLKRRQELDALIQLQQARANELRELLATWETP